ncbi:MAG: hypothetical protein P8N09_03485 [Planctomycetota bacterium]|nr:hypothetical protein [Planctomycetota bacterium]
MRSPFSLLCSLLPFLALGAVLALTPSTTGQALPQEPATAEASGPESGWALVDQALQGLDQACLLQLDPQLWVDVRSTALVAQEQVLAARTAGAPAEICLAIERTLSALLDRQAILAPQASPEGRESTRDLPGIANDLLLIEGRLPQTSLLLIETLFELERDEEGQNALSRSLMLWPRDARVHDTARAWRDVLPRPEDLINQLNARVLALDSSDPQASGLALETIGMLFVTMGRTAYENRKFSVAGLCFDQAAKALNRSASMPRAFSDDIIAAQRADAAVNASMAYLGHAQELWFADRSDKEVAVASLMAAEDSIVTAMQLRPDHDPTLNAVLFIGEAWKDKADVNQVNTDDLADAREFFRRMAERFDVAAWWNNYAFWSRETALAAAVDGKMQQATELFQKSYAAYEKTIELEPDNARYVNDAGLIQLYYLQEDLDRAEELFYRAWKLGKEVCDNPFVDENVAAENLSAYGDAMLNLAELNHQRGDLETAQEINDQLLAISPERFDAQQLRIQIEKAK